jgi:MFS family permease
LAVLSPWGSRRYAGGLSDRTRSRFCRRRPWLLGGLLTSGIVTDWTGRRKLLVFLAATVESVGFVTVALSTSVSQFLVGVAIAGIDNGLCFAVDLALFAAIQPARHRRRSVPQMQAIILRDTKSYSPIFTCPDIFA